MKLLRLVAWTLWFMLCAITYAHAEPISAAIGAVAGLLKAGGIAATLIKAAFGIALQIGSSLLQRAMAKKQAQPGISGQLQVGGNNSFSFIVGNYATAGSLDYVGSWGRAGKTPNAYITFVTTVSDLAQSSISSRIFINNEKCEIDFAAAPTPQGYPVKEYRRNTTDYLWVKVLASAETSADAFLVEAFGEDPDRPWEGDMIGAGATVVLLTARYNRQIFTSFPVGRYEPGPLPLYDPRKDSAVGGSGAHRWGQPATYQASANPVVIIYNILRGIHYGAERIYGPGISAPRLPLASWFAAMNECDVPVAAKGGGTEPQFTAGYEIKVAEHEPADVIDALLMACNGQIAEIGGVYKVRVGPPGLPVMFVTDEDFVVSDPQELDPFKGLEATFNGATASYPDPAAAWEMKDAPQRLFPALEAEDDNRRLLANFQFNAVSKPRQVQRLMKSMILDGRRMRSHRGTLSPVAFGLEPLDVISWTSARNGYINKLFDVRSKDEMANVNQSIACIEVDPSDYDWTPNTDELPWVVGDLDPRWPPPLVVSGWAVLPSSINDESGTPRRPAIDLYCDGDFDDVRAIEIEVYNGGGELVFTGEAPYGEPAPVQKLFPLSGNWCLPVEPYSVRARPLPFSGIEKQWSSLMSVLTLDIRLTDLDVYLPGMVDDLLDRLNELHEWLGDGTRELIDQSRRNVLLDIDDAADRFTQVQIIRQEVTATADGVSAKAMAELLAATGPGSAIAQSLTQLNAAVFDPATGLRASAAALAALTVRVTSAEGAVNVVAQNLTDLGVVVAGKASASALNLLQTQVTTQGDQITANSNALTALDTTVGKFSAAGRFRVTTEATPAGASARIGLSVSASAGGATSTAAIFLDALAGGESRVVVNADQFAIVNGAAVQHPFIVSGGVVRMNVAHIGTVNAGVLNSQNGKMTINLNNGTIEVFS
jgi:hypothetical protein